MDIEGVPHPAHIINQTLMWNHKLFGGREPDPIENTHSRCEASAGSGNVYDDYCNDMGESSLF